ncbi:MAG: protein translocase subunit SecDF [Bacteroidetes bacterium 43-93]|nr:protein translocase subunit SecDF [Bacteroidota bacterium]OJW98737.1 MAG: protein translocase subunit SecDF [Bacteroidetes bacterium 43-93]
MQLKGLVRFFTVALILISLYQLSFTFVVRNFEKKQRSKAAIQAKQIDPQIAGKELEKLTNERYDAIVDSMQGETVMNVPLLKKYTYMEAKEQELNLGLDLQGGMNVTLEVSLDELVRSMSNNPKDPMLNQAIADANKAKANSQANFVTLFGEAFKKDNPNAKLAYLFTKPSEKTLTLQSTNDEVLAKINKEAKDAIKRTYNVLLTRIDKFGVASPNINLDDNKGIITVELAGVRDPERVRNYLQSTAKLQFFETYSNQEIINSIKPANDALASYLSGVKEDTTADTAKQTAVAATEAPKANDNDTASLSSLLAGGKTDGTKTANGGDSAANAMKDAQKKNPLFSVWYPNISQQGNVNQGPVVGIVAKKDTAKLNHYLSLDVVRNKFPNNVKFVYGAQDKKDGRNPNAPLYLYALKTAPGESESKLEGDHVTDARMDYSPLTGKPEVSMNMDVTGARVWKKMTGDNVGKYVAVVLDDKVYSAPLVNGEIPNGSTSISGNFSVEQATDLANILKSGKLPAPAHIVQEQVVGPTLGAESIAAGMNSLVISFIVIFILMLVYYNTGGIVANISLVLNVLFTIGILSALHATLTMPGIAGLVLGIGMAVDTNVIIFERIKEELAGGSSYADAIKKGYTNSLAPVLDGHVTILITSVILFTFGLGPVLGFATTQIISILLSLFCGILVSRLVTDIYTRRERHFKYFTGLSKSIFRKAHFNFVGARKIAYGISVVVLLAGIGSFINGFDYGVEFDGGRSYTVKFDQQHKVSEIREKLKPYFNGEYPVVKTIGQDNQLNITTAYLIKEPGLEVEKKVQHQLYTGLKESNLLSASVDEETFVTKYIQSSQTVLPTISDDLKAGAIKATVFSIIAIFIYILMRFRKWQYSLGTIVALLHDVCVTLAVFSFLKGVVPFALEIDQHFIAAVLTVIGFSMNDTVIVFDRIREYFRKSPKEGKDSVINRAINDTLSRTVMTSLTVFLSVLILFIFGGEVTRGFAFAMLIGVVTGTYSSIFVAAPILVDMDKGDKLKNEVDREAQIEELKKLA